MTCKNTAIFAQDEFNKEKKGTLPPTGRGFPLKSDMNIVLTVIQHRFRKKAGEEVRTLDNDVGNVVLYQLSYARKINHMITNYT